MGLRIRKSKTIMPGVKINVGKKSAGVSVSAGKAHISTNSTGRKSASVNIAKGISLFKSWK